MLYNLPYLPDVSLTVSVWLDQWARCWCVDANA